MIKNAKPAEQFEKLAEVFARYYKPQSAHRYAKLPVFTNPKEALFFVLHYLKSYLALTNMALYFDINVKTVSDYLKSTKKSLKAALQAENVFVKELFKNQSEFEKAFEGIEDLTADCTEIPVQRPDSQVIQKDYYSGKKTTYGKIPDYHGLPKADFVYRSDVVGQLS